MAVETYMQRVQLTIDEVQRQRGELLEARRRHQQAIDEIDKALELLRRGLMPLMRGEGLPP